MSCKLNAGLHMAHCALPMQVKAVQEYLKELLENTDQKLLVFAHHKELLDGVEFAMNKCAVLYPHWPHHDVLEPTWR